MIKIHFYNVDYNSKIYTTLEDWLTPIYNHVNIQIDNFIIDYNSNGYEVIDLDYNFVEEATITFVANDDDMILNVDNFVDNYFLQQKKGYILKKICKNKKVNKLFRHILIILSIFRPFFFIRNCSKTASEILIIKQTRTPTLLYRKITNDKRFKYKENKTNII